MRIIRIEEALTHSVIGAFYEVYNTLGFGFVHKAAERQVYNYLRVSRLEVGLLLHFGPKPKFYRTICRKTVHQFAASVPSDVSG